MRQPIQTWFLLSLAGCMAVDRPGAVRRDAGFVDAGFPDSGPSDGGSELVCPTYATTIQPIWSANCAYSGCHLGPIPSQGMDLSPVTSYSALINISALQAPGRVRVAPGSVADIYLYEKITQPTTGALMPLGRPALSEDAILSVTQWIEAGAPFGEYMPCLPKAPPRAVGRVTAGFIGQNRVGVGQLLTLTSTVYDLDNLRYDGAVVLWRTRDETVAYVDAEGQVLGLRQGQTEALAQSGGVDSPPVPLVVITTPTTAVAYPSWSTQVAPLIQQRCAFVGCHYATVEAGGVRFDRPEGQLFFTLGQASMQFPAFRYVEPQVPSTSYLFLKLSVSDPPEGRQMPQGQARLRASEAGLLFNWIRGGADRN